MTVVPAAMSLARSYCDNRPSVVAAWVERVLPCMGMDRSPVTDTVLERGIDTLRGPARANRVEQSGESLAKKSTGGSTSGNAL